MQIPYHIIKLCRGTSGGVGVEFALITIFMTGLLTSIIYMAGFIIENQRFERSSSNLAELLSFTTSTLLDETEQEAWESAFSQITYKNRAGFKIFVHSIDVTYNDQTMLYEEANWTVSDIGSLAGKTSALCPTTCDSDSHPLSTYPAIATLNAMSPVPTDRAYRLIGIEVYWRHDLFEASELFGADDGYTVRWAQSVVE